MVSVYEPRSALPHAWFWPMVSGRYYPASLGTATSTTSINTPYLAPFFVPNVEGVTVNEIGIEVTATGTGTYARAGIFKAHPVTGKPDLLVGDSGLIDITATGFRSVSGLSIYLPQGWYYSALMRETTSTVRSHNTDPYGPLGFTAPLISMSSSTQIRAYITGWPSGMTPSTGWPSRVTPLTGVVGSTTSYPRVLLRIA